MSTIEICLFTMANPSDTDPSLTLRQWGSISPAYSTQGVIVKKGNWYLYSNGVKVSKQLEAGVTYDTVASWWDDKGGRSPRPSGAVNIDKVAC